MGDGGNVVAMKPAKTLDVDGVRVSQSYSKGEAWLLNQILFAVQASNRERLRVLSADPYFNKLLKKSVQQLKRADAMPGSPKQMHRGLAAAMESRKSICEGFVEAVARGQVTNCSEYAKLHGFSPKRVWVATRSLRAEQRVVGTPELREELYRFYVTFRRAHLWGQESMHALRAHYGVTAHALKELLLGSWNRYASEFAEKDRRRVVGDAEARALLRRLKETRYRSDTKEAAE